MTSGQTRALEIACDESGYEGDKLIDTTTDVFAHASVALDVESAADCMRELRNRIRSPAEEYKANHILRRKHREVLTWFLGESSPLREQAHVFLIDKEYFVVCALVETLMGDEWSRGMTDVLTSEHFGAFDDESWHAFLVAANGLLRARDQSAGPTPVDAFYRSVEGLRRAGAGGHVAVALERLSQTRPRAESFRLRLIGDPIPFSLDPLVPAITSAVVQWSAPDKPVVVLHDQQNTLSPERIAQLTEVINNTPLGVRLVRLILVDSRWDPRIQLADILCGAVRKIAQDERNGRGDPELTALLSAFVDPLSIWGDERSWSLITLALP